MDYFALAVLSAFAAIGAALVLLEIWRRLKAKKTDYVCVVFGDPPEGDIRPDVVLICRTEAEQDEIIRRVVGSDGRRAYVKRW